MNTPALRVLSLGAGVQSTTLLLLAAEGRLPKLDAAVFSDTGWEPAAVYAHLDRIEREVAQPAGIPIYRVSAGNIREDALNPEHRFASMPLFIKNQDGGDGMTRRQCTAEYKLKPIKAQVRQLLGYPHPTPVPRGRYAEQWIGISRDEFGRAKDSGIQYLRSAFPLLDMDGAADGREGWTRDDCPAT
jgi:3'-phosphoadenosine 5'-phosphosulfate sulfotransferase (PAPS reductase)/FAD synthetase